MVCLNLLPYSMTCVRLMATCGADVSTCSALASPAKDGAWLASNRAQAMSAIFGQIQRASFAKYDPDSSSWRTCQGFWALMGTSDTYSGSFPASGMMLRGRLYRQPTVEPLTSASACGSSPHYPTPAAIAYGSNRGGAAGRVGPVRHSLDSMARHNLWPTPTSSRRDRKGRVLPDGTRERISLAKSAKANGGSTTQQTAPLNPAWVEWLMGWPIDATDCEPSGTARFQAWWSMHSELCTPDYARCDII